MIKPAEAMKAAVTMAMGVYAENKPSNFMLEEIEYDKDHDQWLITLSFYMEDKGPSAPLTVAALAGFPRRPDKIFKAFHVDGTSGEVTKMAIRNV